MSISVKITGLAEVQNQITRMYTDLPNFRRSVLLEAGEFLTHTAKANAHTVTGHMKANIGVDGVASVGNSVTVSVRVPYANIENKRPGTKIGQGPHNFFDRAVETTKSDFQSHVVSSFNRFLASHGARTGVGFSTF